MRVTILRIIEDLKEQKINEDHYRIRALKNHVAITITSPFLNVAMVQKALRFTPYRNYTIHYAPTKASIKDIINSLLKKIKHAKENIHPSIGLHFECKIAGFYFSVTADNADDDLQFYIHPTNLIGYYREHTKADRKSLQEFIIKTVRYITDAKTGQLRSAFYR